MNYIRVRWFHENPDAPDLVVSELDDHRWEKRKVEVFADGSKGYAMKDEERGGTRLGLVPLPLSMKSPPIHSSSPRKLPRRNSKRSGVPGSKLACRDLFVRVVPLDFF